MAPSAIVFVCLLALASAAPQCSTSCNASPKTSYAPGTTYTYEYTGKHELTIAGVRGGSSTSDYTATVSLTVVSPCDAAISLQNVAGTNIDNIMERQMEKYPLMVALNNGQVEKVCSHPEDDVSSINVKKAIASAFQNVLPSLEPTSSPQVYTEDDIIGICPTKYTVEIEGDQTIVNKKKIHSNCQEHYYDQTRTSFLPSKTPLPIHDSRSRCSQVITNGIYTNIRCTDTKYITPGFGMFKYVMAEQDLTLQFVSESADTSAVSSIEGEALNSQSLSHQQELTVKNPELVKKVDVIMQEICTLSQGQGNRQVASLVAQAIELLRFVPDDAVVEVLDKIRGGQYCEDYTKLESLFLDAVAFVGEPGAFKVMAQEVAAGRTTGGRFSLYTVAVNLLTRPTRNHVAALAPIFGMPESYQLLSLASATVVNRYCAQNAQCQYNPPVVDILQMLSDKLLTQCTPEFSNAETKKVMTTLASIGNIGKYIPALQDSLMKCASTEGIDTSVRFTAVMAFRGMPCSTPGTRGLKSFVLDASMNTEVRIGSYLAAVRCANADDLAEVINVMSSESNKQVQGFILSHLENLQETNWPLKQHLREILSSKNTPNDYMRNIFKYSRNIEMSINAPVIELGGLVESNIIYTPESYVPRLVNLGLNLNLLGSFINIGELGVRVEGIDPYLEDALGPNSYLYKEVFGSESYLYKTPLWSVIDDSKLFMTQKGKDILQQIQQLIKENGINPDTIVKAVNKMIKNSKNLNADSISKAFNAVLKDYKNIDIKSALNSVDFDSIIKSIVKFIKTNKIQLPRTDLYAILRAQERAFLSFGGKQNQFTIGELIESVSPIIMNALLYATDFNVDSTRTAQINIDYSIPTVTGIPLKLKLTGTGVAGIQLKNKHTFGYINTGDLDEQLKIIPSLNAQVEGQIGFGEFINAGLKLRSSVYTTNGFALNVMKKNGEELKLELELPEKMELFDIETETFFMKLDKTSNEEKVYPTNMKDIRIASNDCTYITEPVTGLAVCYEVNVPDLLNSNSLLLGEPMKFRVYLDRYDAGMKGYRVIAKLNNKPNNKLLKISASTYGSSAPKESTWQLSLTKEEDTYLMATNFQSTLLESSCELEFSMKPDYISLQYYTSGKIGKGIEVEGSVKADIKAVDVSNGYTYEVATYAGLTKSLDEKNRLFQVVLSLLENGENTAAKFLTKTDLYPASFEAVVELPSNAGLRIYKVESITLRSIVSPIEVELLFLKKSSEVYQTILSFTKSGNALATFDAINTISIESPLTGFDAIKLNLMTTANAKLPMVEFGVNSRLSYENGAIEASSGIKYYESEIAGFSSKISYGNIGPNMIEIAAGAKYFDAKVFVASIQQGLDFTSPVGKIQIGVPAAQLQLTSTHGYIKEEGLIYKSSAISYMDREAFATSTKLSFANYAIETRYEAEYFGSKFFSVYEKLTFAGLPLTLQSVIEVPNVFLVDFSHAVDNTGLTTVAKVEAPAVIKPLTFKNVFGISNAFSYSFLTDVTSGESVVLHVEGPLTFIFSKSLVQQNLVLEISGAFDGAFKLERVMTLSLEKLQHKIHVTRSDTDIFLVNTELDRTNAKEVSGAFNVIVPFVIESDLSATISTSNINTNVNTLAFPNTDYKRRITASNDFNWVENNFKGDFYADADNNLDLRMAFTTKYALDTTAGKFLITGELDTTPHKYGYKLESVLASPFDLFQGNSGLELTMNMPTQLVHVAKTMLDIQYADSQVTLNPVVAYIDGDGNKYELTSAVVAKLLPEFLNFDVSLETTLSTPQLQQITLFSKLLHEDNDQSGMLALKVGLKESVLSEACSLEYVLEAAPSTLRRTMKAQYGTKDVSLVSDFKLIDGLRDFEITHKLLGLPYTSTNAFIVKLAKNVDGTLYLAYMKDEQNIVKVYYSLPRFDMHMVGIEFPSRTLEFSVVFEYNQVSFKFSPEKGNSDKGVETILRATPKASAVQFEALMSCPSISNELRLAVELESIEPGKEGYDMVSIDVQYQVSEAPKLVMACLKELQSIYGDLVNDGLFPDINQLSKQAQKFMKRLPKLLNNIRDQLSYQLRVVYNFVEDYVSSIYQKINTPAMINVWKFIQAELLMYWNTIKIETTELLTNLVEVIKTSETWNAVQTTLNEVMVNYPAYYDAAVDFYNTVIVSYVTDLSETVSKLLVLPEFDLSQYVVIIKTQVSTILNNVISQLQNTKALVLFQEKFNELKALYPVEFGLLEDVYTKVIFPTSTDIVASINKLLAVPDLVFQKYWAIVITDVPEVVIKLSQRVLDTEVVQKLRTAYPVVFDMTADLFDKAVLPTCFDVVTLIQNLAANPVDFQVYWNTIQDQVPVIVTQFSERLLDTQIVKKLKSAFPTAFAVIEDFYITVIVPTFEDVFKVVQKLISLPILDFPDFIQKYWKVIKGKVPTLFKNFAERLPNTQLVKELKNLLPTLFEVSMDFYNMVVLPTVDDVVAFVDKLVAVPVADIQKAILKYWKIVKVDVPTLMSKFIQRIPNTQMMNLIQANIGQLNSFLQNKFEELKAQYPEVYSIAFDFYTKVVVPAISDVPMLYNKIIQITDIYQLRDFVTTDILSFVNNLLKYMSTTDLFSKLMAVFDQLAAEYPDEYNTIINTYKQINEITVSNVISAVNSYLFEMYGMSFSISAEKFTAVVPLPVSVATLRNYVQFITVYAPAYAIDVLSQWHAQGSIVYQYIKAQVPVVMDYINTQVPIYLQYVKDYITYLQVVIPQFVNDIQSKLPQYIEEAQAYLYPYVQEIGAMVETYYQMSRQSTYVKYAERQVRDIIEIVLMLFNEVIEYYPAEIQAVKDFVTLYMNICMDYSMWFINTVLEHPTVQKIISYISTLTPEKAQADLRPFLDSVMAVLQQVEMKINAFIATIPKKIPDSVALQANTIAYKLIQIFVNYVLVLPLDL